MAWNVADNTLGLVLARTMTNGHQGGILVVLDGKDMSTAQNWGHVASHELGNSLHVAEDGTFLGVDVGDYWPRGLQLFDFSKTRGEQSKTVYRYKRNVHKKDTQVRTDMGAPAFYVICTCTNKNTTDNTRRFTQKWRTEGQWKYVNREIP